MKPSHVFADETQLEPEMTGTLERLADERVHVHPVDSVVLGAVADTQTPQGIVAIFPFPELTIDGDNGASLVVVVDGIKDPGNFGTLMRAALGAGVDALFLSPQTVDPFSPKVVRSAMGAHFRLPLCSFEWERLPERLAGGAQRFVADATAKVAYDRIDWTQSTVLVVGSETSGISEEARRYAPNQVSIPLKRGLESLNAAVAGAVILFEAARQRRTQ